MTPRSARRTAKKTRESSGRGKQRAPSSRGRAPAEVPDRIFAQASPRSPGGVSLFGAQRQIEATTVGNFMSDPRIAETAASRLADAGFEVLQVTELTINIAGSREMYERAFSTTVVAEERPAIKEGPEETTATFLDSPDTPISGLISTDGTPFQDVLEGVALEEPRYFMTTSSFAPLKQYWHLRVPGDVSLAANADRAHRAGLTGRGVRVAMVDSGWYRHPYFVSRGYRVSPVVLGPAAANPLDDEVGHGTGESANIFAVAPDVELLPVKVNFVNTIGAFNAAIALNPDIITCSWGSSLPNPPLSAADQALAAAIAAAVARGIIVIFSAGNGHWGFPGQHPDVISAGGVFMNPDETFRASDYASGFASTVYPGRNVPDLCGLVGLLPRAAYIMLPLQEGDVLDVQLSGGTHPNGDETARDDGWATFSGTSAAAPQLAGAAALIKQACPRLGPAEVRDVLVRSARDVTAGNCSVSTGGHPATPGPDLATGAGLVDAHRAAMVARLRCMGPIRPITPPIIPPVRPVAPVTPVRPVTPVVPITPIRPPIQPPVQPPIRPPILPPIQPRPPIEPPILPPVEPLPIPEPGMATPRTWPGAPSGAPAAQELGVGAEATPPAPLTQDEITALEHMVINSELDLNA